MIQQRLAELGLPLPPAPEPLASYLPAVRSGDLVWTSGQLPTVAGRLSVAGKVGQGVSLTQAQELAQLCALNALAAISGILDLSQIKQIVKVTGYIASAGDFTQQAQVLNGASDLLLQLFGAAGCHARSAVGVAVLPLDAPVEVELIVRVA